MASVAVVANAARRPAARAAVKDPFNPTKAKSKTPFWTDMREVLRIPYAHQVAAYRVACETREAELAALRLAKRTELLAKGIPADMVDLMAAKAGSDLPPLDNPFARCLVTLGPTGNFVQGGAFLPIWHGFNPATREQNPKSFRFRGLRGTNLGITPSNVKQVYTPGVIPPPGAQVYSAADAMNFLTRWDDKDEIGALEHELARDYDVVIVERLWENRVERLPDPTVTRDQIWTKFYKPMCVIGGARKNPKAGQTPNYADNLHVKVRDHTQFIASYESKEVPSKAAPGSMTNIVTSVKMRNRYSDEPIVSDKATHFRWRMPNGKHMPKKPIRSATGELELERRPVTDEPLVAPDGTPLIKLRYVGVQDTGPRCTYDIQASPAYVSLAGGKMSCIVNAQYVDVTPPDPGVTYVPDDEEELDDDALRARINDADPEAFDTFAATGGSNPDVVAASVEDVFGNYGCANACAGSYYAGYQMSDPGLAAAADINPVGTSAVPIVDSIRENAKDLSSDLSSDPASDPVTATATGVAPDAVAPDGVASTGFKRKRVKTDEQRAASKVRRVEEGDE